MALFSRSAVVDPPAEDPIPRGLRIGAGYTWRLLIIALGIAVVGFLAIELSEIVIPFLIGLLLSALLIPLSGFLHRHHWPKWIAIITAWIVVFAVLGALALLVTLQFRAELPMLEKQIDHVIASAKSLLDTHPFGLTEAKITGYVSESTKWLQSHAAQIGSGAAAAGSDLVHVLEGVLIVIFVTLFLMIDGPRIWTWVTRLFPRRARSRINAAGEAGWHTITSFIRVQLMVAAVDAIGIGVGAWILGLPLAIPIAVIVFLGAFVPIVGAIVGGVFAVGIALIFHGWVQAIIMLGIVVLVMQLEAHLLHPLLTGSAVKVHPLGVILGVTAGTAVAGIAGAFFAVPLIATANSMIVAAAHARPEKAARAEVAPDRKPRPAAKAVSLLPGRRGRRRRPHVLDAG